MPKARPQVRLQKLMADAGIASRRKCEEMIQDGRVHVNGELTMILGTKVDPFYDSVEVDGELIDKDAVDKVYIVLNKPRGIITSVTDPQGRQTVVDLIKMVKYRIFPVGRLDYLSEGLLILTNDGELANKIMHPRYQIEKIYEVKVFGLVNETIMKKLKLGAVVEGDLLKPSSVRIVKALQNKTWIEFRLTEGKNREIRKLCEAVGLTIDKLKRVAIENLSIDNLSPGDYKFLSRKELCKALRMDENGDRIPIIQKYKSPKKSIRLDKLEKRTRKNIHAKDADSVEFTRYRKDQYYETLERQRLNQQQDQLS